MRNLKSILTGTAAVTALFALAAPANAVVTGGTATAYIASPTAVPTAATTFTNATGTVAVNNTTSGTFDSTAATGLFTSGNTITFTLSQGTYANLPTAAATGGGTVSYVSGGAGSAAVTYQISGTVTAVTLTNVNVGAVATVTDASNVRVSVSDGAGALINTAASDKRTTIASFTAPYTVSASAGSPAVNLSATNPGSQYSSGALGTLTITPAGTALKQWGSTSVDAAAGTATIAVSIPPGPFTSATLSSGCGAAQTVTTATANVVTFSIAASGINSPGGVANSCSVTLNNPPTTSTALLGTGATSAAISINLTNAPTSTGSSVSLTQALGTVTFAGGFSQVAGYSVGPDSQYDFFVNVANGGTAGPVIVSANTAGATGTAVLTTSIAANTNQIYSIGQIKTALVAAGMSSTIFSSGGDRGQLTVVVPTGAKVTPLLLNKTNGQVVEVSRQ